MQTCMFIRTVASCRTALSYFYSECIITVSATPVFLQASERGAAGRRSLEQINRRMLELSTVFTASWVISLSKAPVQTRLAQLQPLVNVSHTQVRGLWLAAQLCIAAPPS